MCCNLSEVYIPGCVEWICHKSPPTVPMGPLNPLPVPDKCGDLVAIDFIGPLPEDDSFNMLVTMTDCLAADIRLISCCNTITAQEFTSLFFNHWYCKNDLPLEIISNHDKLFINKFWCALHKLTRIKLKLSSAFHSQIGSASECINKTVNRPLWSKMKTLGSSEGLRKEVYIPREVKTRKYMGIHRLCPKRGKLIQERELR